MYQQIVKGISFVESYANNASHLKNYAADFLYFFVHIADTTDDSKLRRLALSKGKKLAHCWREIQRVPRKTTELVHTLIAEQAAQDLGCIDTSFQKRLHSKISLELIIEMLGFDPRVTPPPNNLNDECGHCSLQNQMGRVFCKKCRKKLEKLSKYDVWLNAIVITHHLKSHRLVGGELFTETLKWIDSMKPYPVEQVSLQMEAWEATYAITHVIYGLTNYSLRKVRLNGLEMEFDYLINSCQQAIDCGDLDILGECIDAIRSFEGDANHELVTKGIEVLMARQNEDGSWGSIDYPPHNRMHTTWTVIDAIRSYSWKQSPVALADFL